MNVPEVRELNPKAVEDAELKRRTGRIEDASKIAGTQLGYPDRPITPNDVSIFSQDSVNRAVLACLARIHVDSTKSLANAGANPYTTWNYLMEAARTISIVYRNQDLRLELLPVKVDHRGRENYFLAEMARDEAKVLEAAVPLYAARAKGQLLDQAFDTLDKAFSFLPDDASVKDLIGFEAQLLKARHNLRADTDLMFQYSSRVMRDSLDLERVATVAAWAYVWGQRLDHTAMKLYGKRMLDDIAGKHVEIDASAMIDREYLRIKKQSQKKALFSVLVLLTTTNNQRQDLLDILLP